MFLTSDQIEEYAARYTEIPKTRLYPMEGELFARLIRSAEPGKILQDDEGWSFAGYGICFGYTLNEEAKPLGKSLWWWYLDLAVYPPKDAVFSLQPPHVVTGNCTLRGGTHQMRITRLKADAASEDRVDINNFIKKNEPEAGMKPKAKPSIKARASSSGKAGAGSGSGKIVPFRPRRK